MQKNIYQALSNRVFAAPLRGLSLRSLLAASLSCLPVSVALAADLARDEAHALDQAQHYALAINPNGTVLEWDIHLINPSKNIYSAHGPYRIPGISSIVAVSAGKAHRMALRADGTVWVWGENGVGQLGQGNFIEKAMPVQVPNLSGVIAISAGANHCVALKYDHTVWAWGRNFDGQVGVVDSPVNEPSYPNVPTPTQINVTNIKQIAAGGAYTLLLKTDGTILGCGSNADGQLGYVSGSDQNEIEKAPLPILVPEIAGATAVAAGDTFALALRNGTVWSWGRNQHGQLGDGTDHHTPTIDGGYVQRYRYEPAEIPNLSDVVKIEAGGFHAAVQKSNGTIWTWGLAEGITKRSSIYYEGYNKPIEVNGALAPVSLSAGYFQTYASFLNVGPAGDIRKMSNASDPLEPSMVADQTIPLPLGRYESAQLPQISTSISTLVNKRQGTDSGLYAVNQYLYNRITPTLVNGAGPLVSVSAGCKRSMAGNLWEIGLATTPQGATVLAKWDAPYQQTSVTRSVVANIDSVVALASQLSAGSFLALKSDGTVWMLDFNYNPTQTAGYYSFLNGTVDLSTLNSLADPVIQISAGEEHFAALTADGRVWTWGRGYRGQLGDNSLTNTRLAPGTVPLPPVAGGGILDDVVSIHCGRASTHVIRRDGTVWAWGYGALGNYDIGVNSTTPAPVQITSLSGKVVAITGSGPRYGSVAPHYLAITRNGKAYAWGGNNMGQLGIGSMVNQLTPCEVTAVPGFSNIVEVAAGNAVSFFRTEDGKIYACGNNAVGLLGDGTLINRSTPTLTLFPNTETGWSR